MYPSYHISGLIGSLPPGIASVSTLVSLDASSDPGLTGTLPAAWSALSSLTYLNVSGDVAVNGPLPGAWSAITTLVVLDVSALTVTGALPESWGALTNLQSLSVEFARLMQAADASRVSRAGQKAMRSRLLSLAGSLQMLRDNLSRQAALNQMALNVVVPAPANSTYSGRSSVYGTLARQGGVQRFLAA